MFHRALTGLAICVTLMAGAGCGWGPFDVSPEPVIVTVTDYEFRVGEDYIHGQVAISIENQTRESLWYHDCGGGLDRLGSECQWQGVWSPICNLVVEEVSIGPGEVLDTSLSIHGYPLRKTRQQRWATPIDTYRLRVFVRNSHEVLSTDGWHGVASQPFSVAT